MMIEYSAAELASLGRYPKQRPPMSPAVERIHMGFYRLSRTGKLSTGFLTAGMESWMHRRVADDVRYRTDQSFSTLEIGAGSLNHLPFEPQSAPYDVVEPFEALYQGSPYLSRVRQVFPLIDAVPSTEHYDRVISIATFEHLCDLPPIVAKAGLLMKPGATLRVGIPSEGTILWKLGCMLTTGIEFRLRYGLNYFESLRHEHVNTAMEIESIIRIFFEEVRTRVFGIARSLSFYQFICASRPRWERCVERAGGASV